MRFRQPVRPTNVVEDVEEFEIPPLVDYYGVPIEDVIVEAVPVAANPDLVPVTPDAGIVVDVLPAFNDVWNPNWDEEDEEMPEQHWCQHCGNYYYAIPTHIIFKWQCL